VVRKVFRHLGRGAGLAVSMFAFYSDDPSSNPGEYFKLHDKTKINDKMKPGLAHL